MISPAVFVVASCAVLPLDVRAWVLNPASPRRSCDDSIGHQFRRPASVFLGASYGPDSSWSVSDDWSELSAAENRPLGGHDVFQQDIADRAAQRLQAGQNATELSPQEVWLHESIGHVLNPSEESRMTSNEEYETTMKDEAQGAQVAMMVRCQQVSEDFLVATGRAIADLTWEQAHDVRQLLSWNANLGWWRATDFLRQGVQTMFDKHLPKESSDWDSGAVSSWMRQSLQEPCGKHDPRVLTVLSRFGNNGRLGSEGLERLYVQALAGDPPKPSEEKLVLSRSRADMHLNRMMGQEAVSVVWRDLKRHGLKSPAEITHEEEWRSIQDESKGTAPSTRATTKMADASSLMDECEIIDDAIPDGWYKDYHTGAWQRHGKSSHEKLQMADDGVTPLFHEDGDYVYIDEESCIGCTQCALAAPASFQMLENGRARTFLQRGRTTDVTAAVKTCPVNCMHYVDFERLQTLEKARDSVDGDDGRADHRHFGRDKLHNADKWRAHTPLYVARMDSSDANHKDSLYNHVVRQCYKTSACPSKGCYDCPMHKSNPEANPHLHTRRQANLPARAQTFCDRGIADFHRRTADL